MRHHSATAPRRRRIPPGPLTVGLVLVLALTSAACSGESTSDDGTTDGSATSETSTSPNQTIALPEGSTGCDEAVSVEVGATEEEVVSNDEARAYARYVPTSYDGAPVPLVIDLHGYLSGGSIQAEISGFETLAEREGFVVATPQGNSEMPYWNATPEASLPDDVQLVSDVIAEVGASVCLDPSRVYVDGFSNGAFMASLIACRLGDEVAAVAAVAGLLYPEGCEPSRAVPILAIHGTDDEYVSFAGAPNPALETLTWNEASRAAFAGLPFDDVTVTQSRWATAQGCDPTPSREAISAEVELIAYTGCDDASTVQLYVVEAGGHTWPGSEFTRVSESALGRTTFDIDATETIWAFFEEHPMRR